MACLNHQAPLGVCRHGTKPSRAWRDLCVNFTREYVEAVIAQVQAVLEAWAAGTLAAFLPKLAAAATQAQAQAQDVDQAAASAAEASGAKRSRKNEAAGWYLQMMGC